MSKAVIVFSGFNTRAVIAFLRTLESNNVPYGIIAVSSEDAIFMTDYKKKVLAIRNVKQLNLDDLLNKIETAQNKLNADKYVVVPSTEALNRFLLKHRLQFEKLKCEVPLVAGKLYEKISDKYTFGQSCRESGILVPVEYDNVAKIKLPLVAKPKTYFAKDGSTYSPVLIHDVKALADFKKVFNPEDFYYQEFLKGDSLYLLYYFYKDGSVSKFSQKNLIQQPGGKSIIAAVSSDFHNDTESKKYERLFKTLRFFGLVMIEVKKINNKYYMIEANPRFWGPSQLFVDAGVNLFEAFLFDEGLAKARPERIAKDVSARYFWYGGMVESLHSQGRVVYHDYSEEHFKADRGYWMAADIYNRKDTQELFRQETHV